MGIYLYRAKDRLAKVIEGKIEAESKQEAIAKIDSLGLFPVLVEEKKTPYRKNLRISTRALLDFTIQLSTLLNSGSSLVNSLTILASETEPPYFKQTILDIISQVKEGESFSACLEKYPLIFTPLYVSLIKVGERSGTLGENLKRITNFLEEELDFKSELMGALLYPFLVVCVGILTIFALLKFVIPKIVSIFEELGQQLPLPTRFLITLSSIFSHYWFAMVIFIVILFFLFKQYLHNPYNRKKWDIIKLKLPIFGDLWRKIEIHRFARTLSLLLKNGIPIDASLHVIKGTIANLFIKEQVERLESEIKEGVLLSEAMEKIRFFSTSFTNIVTVGEEAGTLAEVLENVSFDYKKYANRKIKMLMSLLEPILILGVGLSVGFVVLSMLLPIFQIDFNI